MDTKIEKEIIPKDQIKGLLYHRIDKLKEKIFDAQIGERFLQRKVLTDHRVERQLADLQKMIKEDKEYLKFLEEIIKEY